MDATWWLTCNFLSIVALAFYSMVEMACVSINKARLHFYALEGSQRARWLQRLLLEPSRLFGTTLVGVNLATVVGSECGRELYSALGLDPDLAPITQVAIVVIFGELAPMFAARQYAEHVALLGAPLLYLSERLLSPFLWALEWLMKLVHFLLGSKEHPADLFLSREELQKIMEEHETQGELVADQELKNITASLFKMHMETVGNVMTSLANEPLLPSDATIIQLRNLWHKTPSNYAILYQKKSRNIVGIIQPRDVLRADETHRVGEYAHSPWFVTEGTNLSHMIKQFRHNNQNVAIILSPKGEAIGVVSFTALINEVFGFSSIQLQGDEEKPESLLWEKTLSGAMTVAVFENEFGTRLDDDGELTLSEVIIKHSGHCPNSGDRITIGTYEITIKTTSLLDIKTLSVKGRA